GALPIELRQRTFHSSSPSSCWHLGARRPCSPAGEVKSTSQAQGNPSELLHRPQQERTRHAHEVGKEGPRLLSACLGAVKYRRAELALTRPTCDPSEKRRQGGAAPLGWILH